MSVWSKWVGGLGLGMALLAPVHADPKVQKTITAPAPATTVAPDALPTQVSRATLQLVSSVGPNDHLGQALVKGVVQRMGQSPRFQLVGQPQEAGLILHLVTISPDPQNQITAYSETYTIAPHNGRPEEFVYATVTVCGEERVNDCAEGIMQEMGHVLDMVQRSLEQRMKQVQRPPEVPTIEV